MDDGDTLSFARGILNPTVGKLITHLRTLEDAGYMRAEKTCTGTASLTAVALTRSGRAAL